MSTPSPETIADGRRWLLWSPVAAVLWVAMALAGLGLASGVKGCAWTPAGPVVPDKPDRPDWLPDNPPAPPEPTPNPMGETIRRAGWEWRAFPPGDQMYGWEAYCTTIDGESFMKYVRPIRRSRR